MSSFVCTSPPTLPLEFKLHRTCHTKLLLTRSPGLCRGRHCTLVQAATSRQFWRSAQPYLRPLSPASLVGFSHQCTMTASCVGGAGALEDPLQRGRVVLFVYGETATQPCGCGGIKGG